MDARYVLFLNPDTELLEGTLGELVAELDDRPEVGIAGVRQIGADGNVYPTMRRFPNVARALGDALGLERLAARPGSLGERELVDDRYDREFESDWTIGSFMLARSEALAATGGFDERFFVYSEEVDLCLRIKRAGWKIVHLPTMTILHHGSTVRALDCAHGAAERLCAAAVRGEALRRTGARRVSRRAASPLRACARSRRRAIPTGGRPRGRRRRSCSDGPSHRSAGSLDEALARHGCAACGSRRACRSRRRSAAHDWQVLSATMRDDGPGVIGRDRRFGHACRRADRAAGRDVHRSRPQPQRGRARLRRLLRPLGERFTAGERPPELVAELRALVARQAATRAAADRRGAGRSRARSTCCRCSTTSLPGFRFLHLVRDGRDMAFSDNQVQLRKHGDAVLGSDDEAPGAVRSISLWSDVNLRAADYGERKLGAALPARALRGSLREPACRSSARSSASSGSTATSSASQPRRWPRRRRSDGGACRIRRRSRRSSEHAARGARAVRLPVLVCVEPRPHVLRRLADPRDLVARELRAPAPRARCAVEPDPVRRRCRRGVAGSARTLDRRVARRGVSSSPSRRYSCSNVSSGARAASSWRTKAHPGCWSR